MTKEIVYIAEDGARFDNENDCIQHEACYRVAQAALKNTDIRYSLEDTVTIVRWLNDQYNFLLK